jgi:hypothetical protein
MAWELQVKRLGLQKNGDKSRTYGAYQVVIDGTPVASLSGHICERPGPGDNTSQGVQHHVRIREGRYALSTQFGDHYRTVGFTNDANHPMPGILVLGTGARTAILVHPGHPPNLYLSSIGCFNPTEPLDPDDEMDFEDSRARVIALIDSLKQHDPDAFTQEDNIGNNTPITDAFIVITGEPTGPVPADAVA